VVGEQETGPLDSRCYWLGVALQLLGQYLWLAGSSDPQFTDVNARLRALRLSLGTGIFTYTSELLRRRRFLHRTLAINVLGLLSLAWTIREQRYMRRSSRRRRRPGWLSTKLYMLGHALQLVGIRRTISAHARPEMREAARRPAPILMSVAITGVSYLLQERPRRWDTRASQIASSLHALIVLSRFVFPFCRHIWSGIQKPRARRKCRAPGD
jgi:hypothetical protein